MTRATAKSFFASLLLATVPLAHADHHDRLMGILDGRSDEAKARDEYRHPAETLQLFGIKEGMTVIDALPGSWYGDIIAPLLGSDGKYIGVRYGDWFYKNRFGDEYAERWEGAQSFLTEWPTSASEYGGGESSPATEAYFFPGLPASLDGSVDAALFFRALHHTNRYEPKYLDMTAADAYRVLKSGGIVGIVQHRAPENADDVWADGDNGYLKQSRVIEAFKGAGFMLENASEINANRKDQPTTDQFVWRLPPSSDEAEALAIGESDRMTLVFKKP
ncbi:MAG: methyltransferase [Pseudomonadota bacterium]